MIFQCLMSNSNFSLQIQTFSNLRKVVQIKPNQISNVKFKSNSNQTSFEALPSQHMHFWPRHLSTFHNIFSGSQQTSRPTSLKSSVFAVDVFSLILNGALLWHFCRINIMKSLKSLQQEFWLLFGVAELYLLLEVNIPLRQAQKCNSFFFKNIFICWAL